MPNSTVGVIGTGSFGLSVAKLLANNQEVLVYGRNPETLEALRRGKHKFSTFLPSNLSFTNDYAHMCASCTLICPAIPSGAFMDFLNDVSPYLRPSHFIIHTSKGLYALKETPGKVYFISELIQKYTNVLRIGYLSGPNLSKEIMEGLPAAALIASTYDEVLQMGKTAFDSADFRIVQSRDIEGAQIAGAFKNIIALGTGMLEGLGWGKNAQAYFITRGWQELLHIGALLCNVTPYSMLGLAGIGDLFATATSNLSRNFSFGREKALHSDIGRKYDYQNEDLAEGVFTVKILHELLQVRELNSPLIRALYSIIHEEQHLQDILKNYLSSDEWISPDFLQNL